MKLTENLFVKNKKCSNIIQETLNKFAPIARQIYIDIMKFKSKHNVSVRETGIVIQPLLYWLAASPNGLITDESGTPIFGLIEINSPFSKRNLHLQDMPEDKNFYVGITRWNATLKRGAFKWLLFSNPDGNGSISVEVL